MVYVGWILSYGVQAEQGISRRCVLQASSNVLHKIQYLGNVSVHSLNMR